MLDPLTTVLANVLPGFQGPVSSSYIDFMVFSPFDFFTLSCSCEIQTALIPQSPGFPALPPAPLARAHSARRCCQAGSPTPSNPGTFAAASLPCSFLSHPLHPPSASACLLPLCRSESGFWTQSISISGKPLRNVDSQAPLRTYWIRICIFTRSTGDLCAYSSVRRSALNHASSVDCVLTEGIEYWNPFIL